MASKRGGRPHAVHECGRDAVEQPADRRAADRPRLAGDRPQRHRAGQQPRLDQGWRHRPGGGRSQRHRDAGAGGQRQIRHHRPIAGAADEDQADADPGADDLRSGEHEPAREAVGELSGGQGQHEHRQELGEADPTEVERAVLLGVDLPADGHLQHLEADPHADHGQPPEAEIPHLQRRAESSHSSRG
jgi:hypothetical protein